MTKPAGAAMGLSVPLIIYGVIGAAVVLLNASDPWWSVVWITMAVVGAMGWVLLYRSRRTVKVTWYVSRSHLRYLKDWRQRVAVYGAVFVATLCLASIGWGVLLLALAANAAMVLFVVWLSIGRGQLAGLQHQAGKFRVVGHSADFTKAWAARIAVGQSSVAAADSDLQNDPPAVSGFRDH